MAFAKRFGTSEANIRNYRTRITPKVEFLVQVCNELEISFDWLFNDSGQMKRKKNNGDESQDINVPNETKLYKLMGNYRERIDSLYQVIENQEKAIKTFEEIVFDK